MCWSTELDHWRCKCEFSVKEKHCRELKRSCCNHCAVFFLLFNLTYLFFSFFKQVSARQSTLIKSSVIFLLLHFFTLSLLKWSWTSVTSFAHVALIRFFIANLQSTHQNHLDRWFLHFIHHIRHMLFILTIWDQLDVKRTDYRRAFIVNSVKSSRHKTRRVRILSRTRWKVWIQYWKNERNKNISFYNLSLSLLLTYMTYYLNTVASWNTILICFSRKLRCQISKYFKNECWIVTRESMRH